MLKKSISIILSLALMVISLLSFSVESFAASKMTLSGSSTVYTYCTSTLTVKINSKKVAASKCSFTSSNKSVATVNASGVVTGVKKGTAIITVKQKSNSKVKSTIKITVKSNTITSPAYALNFAKGCSNTLIINVSGKRAGSGTVSFATSNKSIATVDSNGKVTAKAKGTAYITVKVKKNTKIYRKIKINVIDSKSFTITNTTLPLNGTFLNYGSYNSYSKNYYTIRSYLEYFEKHPGCTLTLKAGKYSICTSLYIPSSTTIKLLDGVVLNKTSQTGTSSLPASSTLFMFCAPSKAKTAGAYSEYNGVHDSKVLGYGSAKIDLKSAPSGKICTAFVMGHNKNITVSGINFTNCAYGHFIEMDASQNVTVSNCTFSNQMQPKLNSAGECINLDTPDKITNGFTQEWTSYDCTPNMNINITNCTFTNVQRAVGTHQYSQEKYHTNVTISNCNFNKCMYGAVYLMNWKDFNIVDNNFNGVGMDTNGKVINNDYLTSDRALLFAGCSGSNVSGNHFKNCYQIGAITNYESNGFPMIYNSFTDDELNQMMNENYCDETVSEPYIKAYVLWDGVQEKATNYYISQDVAQ